MKQPKKRARKAPKPNGYVLFEDSERVVIATGFRKPSQNRKTGKMIQIWILARNVDPVTAVKTGQDELICGNCPHRGTITAKPKRVRDRAKKNRKSKASKGTKRTCYVNVGQAPLSVWRAWQRGSYPLLPSFDMFTARAVRLGAYGDPVHIPLSILEGITARAMRWTGYTHQWRNAANIGYRALIMASCDSTIDLVDARAAGWRTFRVRETWQSLQDGEINCPASPEGGNKSQCARCGLCNGAHGQKDIAIIVHGSAAKNFISLDSLIAKAA